MPKKVNASHILVKTESEAFQILGELASGKKFEDLAMQKSMCPSKKKGGELGWFGRGQMIKEFENAAFMMKKGEISKPVKTQFGWHVIRVNEVE